MRDSLKGIRARVDRLAAEQERRQGSTHPAELVRILEAGRLEAPARAQRQAALTEEERDAKLDEAQATGRALRARLRKAGHPFFP